MDEPRWLDEQEARAWRRFQRLNVRFFAHIERSLVRDSGLSSAEYAVLVALSEVEDGRLRAFELGDELQWEKSRLSHQVTRMERRGLVERMACEEDARGSFVAITALGQRTIEAAAPIHVEDVRTTFIDPLSGAQLDQLADIAQTILERLEQVDAAVVPAARS